MIKIDTKVLEIKKIFKENNIPLFIVGGVVRDFLINNKVKKDYDLITSAKPFQVKQLLREYKLNSEHEKYGCIKLFLKNDIGVEITTFRKEKYNKSRYPHKIVFIKNLKKDLKRRDFTINAICYDFKKIIDPLNGVNDLKKKKIKLIGGENKIKQDPLRILRGLRFSLNLGFKIDKKSLKYFNKNKHLVKSLSKRAIKKEFDKIKTNNQIPNTYLSFFNIK